MSDIDKLISIARAEIGVTEHPANSDNVKYNTEYYGRTVSSTASAKYYWCVVFQWWLFKQAGLSALFYGGGKTASCGELKNYAKSHGQWVTSGYQRGDLVMFNFKGGSAPSHIGFCVSATDKKVTTIDGNTGAGASASQDNGGMVQIRTRDIKTYVVGAYRPNYHQESDLQTVAVCAPILHKGVKHPAVRVLQAFLNVSGYPCGDVDGDFGSKTDAALRAFQNATGLSIDGSCGPKTWEAILGV